MPQPILGIKGTAEYVEASGDGTVESPYIPTVYVANPGSGGGGGTSSTVTITGTLPSFATTQTFNANAGTNLNTSLLALESNGNLAGINTKLPASLGTKTAATSFPVTLSSDGASSVAFAGASNGTSPWFTKSNTYFQTYTIAKNAQQAAYIAGDVYGTRFELTNFGVTNGSFFLVGVNLVSSLSALPSGMGLFSLFLFDSIPTEISDNGAFTLASSSITPQGILLNPLSVVTNSNAISQTSQINELFRRGSSTLYAYLVTQSPFTPGDATANTMTITLKAIEA